MKSYKYIAVDVSKLTLQVLRYDGKSLCLNYQDKDKLLDLVEEDTLVVFEATGGYERQLKQFLDQKGVLWAMVHPARIRAFAKACAIEAKTDKIDAQVILQYAQTFLLSPAPATPVQSATLAALMDRRSQLVQMIKQEKTRLGNCDPLLVKCLEEHLAFLQNEQAKLEQSITEHLASDSRMQKQFETICSVKGLGKASAWNILAYLPELPSLKRNQAAALAGLAPYNRDSGTHCGKRSIHGGRFKIRCALYMAAVVATQHNSHISAYYHRLTAAGKPAKCALVAVMRKLLLHVRSLLIGLAKGTPAAS